MQFYTNLSNTLNNNILIYVVHVSYKTLITAAMLLKHLPN